MSIPRQVIAGRIYMVTRRCTQRQFLLRPDAATTNAFTYCLAFAAERTNMGVVAFLAHSNHHHTIVVDRSGRMPEFLERFHKLFAKHQNALRGRWENFWASEATSVVELPDPDDVLAKMTYALTNPVKDHLIERAHHWPGASSLHANVSGRVLRASRPPRFFRKDGPLPDSVTLRCVRPPGFEHLSRDEWQKLIAGRVRDVEEDAAIARGSRGLRILGRAGVLRQRPTDRPASHEPRRKLSPRVASLNKWARVEALRRSRTFTAAYQRARTLWQAGLDAIFPVGTYWLRRFASVPIAQDPAPA
jgi:putative transposase